MKECHCNSNRFVLKTQQTMLVNFALDFLGTRVSCNKVSTDGHNCENLISSDSRCRSKGFLAEHFIKPPVDVTLSFPCNVNIFCILLDPFVGRQQSSQIEIYSASKPLPKTNHGKKRRQLEGLRKQEQSVQSQNEPMPIFQPLSKATVPNQTRACFYSRRFPSHLSADNQNLMSIVEPGAKFEMRNAKAELLTSATQLSIRISRIQNGSTPALNKIEIWGCVSSLVNTDLRKHVLDQFKAFCELSARPNISSPQEWKSPSGSSSSKKGETEEKGKSKAAVSKGIQIPEEFLDALTCEIMAIPMLLPSGKNVDKMTLDRYFDSEASHGRQPRDPFTGVEFYGDSKPIPNASLKARIDQFLSLNRNEPTVAKLPRTLVSGENQQNFFLSGKRKFDDTVLHASSIISSNKKKPICVGQALKSNSNSCDQRSNDCSSSNQNGQRAQSPCSNQLPILTPSSSSASIQQALSEESPLHRPECKDNELVCSSDSQKQETSTSKRSADHESSLKDSLNFALSAVLSSSSPINVGKDNESGAQNSNSKSEHKNLALCLQCQKQFTEDMISYTFPCSHSLCRPCLLSRGVSKGMIVCSTCGVSCLRSEVIRTHCSSNGSKL